MSKTKNTSNNYYKEYKEIQAALAEAQLPTLVSSIIQDYIEKIGNEFERQNNQPEDIYLRTVVELFVNIFEELNTEAQNEIDNFLQQDQDNLEERIYKMVYIILSFSALQGIALKKASIRLNSWLEISPESDYSELQSKLYNLGVEIVEMQKALNFNQN